MSQAEILDILKKNKSKWYSAYDIKQIINRCTISASLKKLRETNLIDFKKVQSSRNKNIKEIYVYKWSEN